MEANDSGLLESLKEKVVRETAPIYTCSTLYLKSPEVESVYNHAIQDIVSGNRETFLGYIDGMGIHSPDISRQERVKILETISKIFEVNGIDFESCYPDILARDSVNFGLYFQDQSQLDRLMQVYKDKLKISFVADVQPDGKYKLRDRAGRGIGHDISEPHLIKDGTILGKEESP